MPDVTGAPVPDEAKGMLEAQQELRRKVLEKAAQDPDFVQKLIQSGEGKDALVEAGLGDDVQKVEQAASQRLQSAEVAGHSCGYFWYYGDLWYYTY